MQNSELKKNLSNDTIFNAINKMFISLEDNDIHKTNEALLPVCFSIIYYDIINYIIYIILLYNIII